MGKFKFTKTSIEGLYIIEPMVFGDDRAILHGNLPCRRI